MGNFADKVALVTGAGSGIGRATALAFAREGASVIVADVTDQGRQTTQDIAAAGDTAHFIQADVSDPLAAERLIAESVATYGRLDIAFNNAGIGGVMAPTADVTLDDWQRLLGSNLTGVWLCMKHELAQMSEQDDWDAQFEGHNDGWLMFFRILNGYLTHFRGQPGASFQLMGVAPEPTAEAWAALTGPLGLADAVAGQRVSTRSSDGAPPLAGTVEWVGQPAWPGLLVRTDAPAPGLAHLFPLAMGQQLYLTIRFYLYGDEATAAAERAEAAWQSWVTGQFKQAAG